VGFRDRVEMSYADIRQDPCLKRNGLIAPMENGDTFIGLNLGPSQVALSWGNGAPASLSRQAKASR